ncbi:MAG TPA: insulinase family protein [Candidatus Acidoferrum sp.]|nr:insulinase family protein [Candidatus Acidoferrum sp.]
MSKQTLAGINRQGVFGLALFASALALTVAAQAQNLPLAQLPQQAFTIALDQQTPLDPKVTKGELKNGMHYYIRENKEPRQRAELRLVVDAGSILENDNQLGLAHVLEHMAFNGTEHFPKQSLVSFMESIGMKFGNDVNASTSFDETLYMLQVPTDKPEPLDQGLEIMQDWAHSVTMEPAEVDQERNVVAEEWRLGQGAQNRVRNKQLPVLLKDSRYATRLPIGTLDSIQHFDRKVLRQFYQDWYRPELMAVVAVGDFDKATVEKLIHQHFDALPASKNARPRQRYDVPSHNDTLFAITTDPEVTTTSVSVYQMLPPITDWTPGGVRQRMVEDFYNTMLSLRFQELSRQPNAPFLAAQSAHTSLVRPVSAYVLAAAVPETGAKRGLEALLTEAEKVKRFGFSQAEFDRVKTVMQRNLEQMYAARDNRSSASHAAEMIRSYLTGESIPGTEFEVALRSRFVNTITLEETNQVGKQWIGEANRVVTVTMPEKAGLVPPTEAELKEVIANVAKADIKPNVETSNDQPLLPAKPKGSPVTQTRTLEGGITEWTLGNGVKVAIKPTDFKQDEIVFSGFVPGGTSLASDADYIAANTAASIIANGGLGNFNGIELQRKLAGKVARVNPFIADYEEGIQGGGSPADLETMLQLIYLRFTAPRADAAFFQVFQTQLGTVLQNRNAAPATAFSDAFEKLFYQNHPRRQPPTPEMLQQTDLAKSMTFYQDRFRDASGFTFVFVGNFDPKALQPLVETYLGGLPAAGRKETWKDVGIRYVQGVKQETVKRGLEPQSRTRIVWNGKFDVRNTQERVKLSLLMDLVQNHLREIMREQLGGTYSVSVSRLIEFRPEAAFVVNVDFGSAPERADELANTVFAEIARLQQNGPTDTEFANVREAAQRSYETGLRQNQSWLAQLQSSYQMETGNGVEDLLNYPKTLASLSTASMRDAMREFFPADNHVRVTLLPEK